MEASSAQIRCEDRLAYLESSRRFTQNSLEMALSLGDFQEEINRKSSTEEIIRECENRVQKLLPFEIRAFYLVDQNSSDFLLEVCEPEGSHQYIEKQVEFMIENGFMAWAIRERRGVPIFSQDQKRQIFLHVISTYSRIRGMFVGLLPEPVPRITDYAYELMSILLRNTANALESIEYYRMMRNQRRYLKRKVEEKTREVIHYEVQLQQAKKMEAIATLAGGIAHEFNNALAALIGNLELCKMGTGEDLAVRKYIERTEPSTRRMAQLTSQLLAYAHGGKYNPQTVSLSNFVRETLPAIRHTIDPEIHVDMDLPREIPEICADLTQMQMVLSAVLLNATEAMTNTGRIRIHTTQQRVEAGDFEDLASGVYSCLTIKDDGIGMDKETQGRMFDPFFSTKSPGRGLGMAAAYGVVKNHSGSIIVDSAPGQGTMIQIFLPATEKISEVNPVKTDIVLTHVDQTVLIVEDEELVMNVTREMIKKIGFRVLAAASGNEARQIVENRAEKIDIFFIDLILPDMSAKALFETLHKSNPEGIFIVSSGYSIDGPAKEILDSGAHAFLQKPFSFKDLTEILGKLLI